MVDFENYRLSDYLANRLDNLKGTSPIAPGKGSLPNEVRQSLIGATDHQFRFADGYDKGIQLFTQLLEELSRLRLRGGHLEGCWGT